LTDTTSAQCTWTASTGVPASGLDMPVVGLGSNMYAFGVTGGAIVATSNKFDGTTWSAIASRHRHWSFHQQLLTETDIYIMGGARPVQVAPQNTNYRYNVATNTYTTLASITYICVEPKCSIF